MFVETSLSSGGSRPSDKGEGGHPDPEINGGGGGLKSIFFGPWDLSLVQNKGGGRVPWVPRAPPLDPPLLSHWRQQSFIQDSHAVDHIPLYIQSTKVTQTVPFVSISFVDTNDRLRPTLARLNSPSLFQFFSATQVKSCYYATVLLKFTKISI